MQNSHTLRYVLAGIIVVILGSLLGWYAFVHRQIAATQASDAARGFGSTASFGSSAGGTYDNLSSNTSGGGSAGAWGTASNFGAMAPFGSSAGGGGAGTGVKSAAPRLWHITATTVAGFGFSASTSKLYFAERATGNVLIADPADSSIVRLTNTLFPKIYEAFFSREGSVVLRSVDDAGVVTTYAGSLATTTVATDTPQTLPGRYLPQNIVAVSARSSPAQLFFLVKNPQGGVAGATSDWRGASQKQVFTSALSGWRTWWLPDGAMYIAQKASDDISGYAFKIQKGQLVPLAGPVSGLTVLPRTGSTALIYGASGGGALSLSAQASASNTPVRLPVHTVADKCVWAPGKALIAYCAVPIAMSSSAFLRDWYAGVLHTTDIWWRVDVSAGTAEKLFATDLSLSLDVKNPMMDESGSYIAFMNGSDETLWMLRITP